MNLVFIKSNEIRSIKVIHEEIKMVEKIQIEKVREKREREYLLPLT